MTDLKESLDKLDAYLAELECQYIDPHKDPLEIPERYKLDVRSYCVLSHAAFEEFVENVCICTLAEIVDQFKNSQCISYSTLCLLHFHGNAKVIDDDTWKHDDRVYDYLLKQLENNKSDFSKYIMIQNHGVGLKYLKKLLVPLGLYVPLDVKNFTALENLSQSRGGYAHTSHRNVRSLSPEDAKTQVQDVHEIMVALIERAKKISYYSIH